MPRRSVVRLLLPLIAMVMASGLAGCDRPDSAEPRPTVSASAGLTPPPQVEPATLPGAAVPTPETGEPGPTIGEKGEKGARAVLLAWARAIEFGRYAEARAQWGEKGAASGLDAAAYAAQFTPYRRITIGFGDGEVEGAAGSLFYEVPVTFTGTLTAGRVDRREGRVTLRRVNDVPGASAEQLRWHIEKSTMPF